MTIKLTKPMQNWLQHLARGGYIRRIKRPEQPVAYESDSLVLITQRIVVKMVEGGFIEWVNVDERTKFASLTELGIDCSFVSFLLPSQLAMLRDVQAGKPTEANMTRGTLRARDLIDLAGRLTKRAEKTLAAYDKGLL